MHPECHPAGLPPSRMTILENSESVRPLDTSFDDIFTAIVSVGAGETHVSVLDLEARTVRNWVAIFGWSSINRLRTTDGFPLDVVLEDEGMMSRALSGSICVYGIRMETQAYILRFEQDLRDAISEILDRTIGTGAGMSSIQFASSSWMHESMSRSVAGLRPNISMIILEIG